MMGLYACLEGCCASWSQRWVVSTAVLGVVAIQYIHRIAFNLAITDITYTQSISEEEFSGACQYGDSEGRPTGEAPPSKHREFDWDTSDQALLVGSFYIGYILTHLPGGILADRYGPKRVLGWGVFLSGLCTLLTPVAARAHLYVLVALRSTMGLAQGPLFPAQSVFVARWAMPHERSLLNSYMNVGVVIGAVLGNACTGLMLSHVARWDTVFYVYAGLTVLWLLVWLVLAHDSVALHPYISVRERTQLEEALKEEVHEEQFTVDYCALVKSAPVWAMVVASLGHDWAFYIVLSLLPQYMSYVLLFDVSTNGLINSLPYLAMLACQLLSAMAAQKLITKKVMTKTVQCKVFFFVTNQGPVVCFLAASYAGCSRFLVVALFTAAMGFIGFCYSSIRVVNVDMAPNLAGLLMAIMNGAGAVCGFLGPEVFSIFTEEHTVENWRRAFILSAVLISTTTVVFCVWGRSEIQLWNFPGTTNDTAEVLQEDNQQKTNGESEIRKD